ncbi:MAG: hypothetical protein A2091_03385 [Desulfuromonadales bacterium GWD2_61_12]|nr:MAG: hypothetical protein A2005_06295 [Desulfuromonadales bacterium GWC2_61_20]OGR34946.1 MAG: hypothetical protein A2091_03385 [Desulfuromonadales bacterium GWD2_61_12]HAD04436.1 hypothetical protein [Desulfuromonas sp.]
MKLGLNLASRVYVNRRTLMIFYVITTVLLLLLLGLNLSSLLRTRADTTIIGDRLAELKRAGARTPLANAAYSPPALAQLEKRTIFANSLLARDHFRWTELLDDLEGSTPAGISIRGVQPDFKSGAVKISGVARSVSDLRRFLDRLAANPHFTGVLLFQQANVRSAKSGDVDGVNFSIGFHRVVPK